MPNEHPRFKMHEIQNHVLRWLGFDSSDRFLEVDFSVTGGRLPTLKTLQVRRDAEGRPFVVNGVIETVQRHFIIKDYRKHRFILEEVSEADLNKYLEDKY
jgi:hypothetical protein